MNPRRLLITWLAVLTALAITVSACGNDDDAPASSEPEPTVAPSEPEPEPTAEPEPEPEPEPTAEPEPEPTPQELRDVSLRLPWFPSVQFAGSYVAAAKGFFEEEGLNVTINPGGFDVNSITLVAAGSDDFGLHDTNSLIFAAVEEIPLVTVATYLHAHPGAIMSLETSGFESLDDLVGATIGF